MAKHAKELTLSDQNNEAFLMSLLSAGLDSYLEKSKAEVEIKTDSLDEFYAGYDWNIFVPEYNTISLSAYPWVKDADGTMRTDCSGWVSLTLTMTDENSDVISYLLGDSNWQDTGWVDHDDWVDENFLTADDAPGVLKYFVRQIKKLTKAEFDREARKYN